MYIKIYKSLTSLYVCTKINTKTSTIYQEPNMQKQRLQISILDNRKKWELLYWNIVVSFVSQVSYASLPLRDILDGHSAYNVDG